jgi:DNA-binding response OmpR family regulator
MVSAGLEVRVPHVLLATADPVLRQTRAALITSFGFHTIASLSLHDALTLISACPFDILVLGHTLSAEACHTISTEFRRHNRKGRVVEILRRAEDDCNDHPDVTVVGLEGPLSLRNALLEQLRIARLPN